MSSECMPSDLRLCMLAVVCAFDWAPVNDEAKYSFGLGIYLLTLKPWLSLPEYCV